MTHKTLEQIRKSLRIEIEKISPKHKRAPKSKHGLWKWSIGEVDTLVPGFGLFFERESSGDITTVDSHAARGMIRKGLKPEGWKPRRTAKGRFFATRELALIDARKQIDRIAKKTFDEQRTPAKAL